MPRHQEQYLEYFHNYASAVSNVASAWTNFWDWRDKLKDIYKGCLLYLIDQIQSSDQTKLLEERIQQVETSEKIENYCKYVLLHQVIIQAQIAKAAAKVKDDIYRPDVMKTIEVAIGLLSPELRSISMKIHGASILVLLGT